MLWVGFGNDRVWGQDLGISNVGARILEYHMLGIGFGNIKCLGHYLRTSKHQM
jgi:hypothetical protein